MGPGSISIDHRLTASINCLNHERRPESFLRYINNSRRISQNDCKSKIENNTIQDS